jgi:carbon-monoxide dehydrogenase catalytic subunit
VQGSPFVEQYLTRTFEKHFGATWAFEPDPIKAAHLMIDHIDRKRLDLGLPPPMYDVPYAPKAVEAAPAARSEALETVGAGA